MKLSIERGCFILLQSWHGILGNMYMKLPLWLDLVDLSVVWLCQPPIFLSLQVCSADCGGNNVSFGVDLMRYNQVVYPDPPFGFFVVRWLRSAMEARGVRSLPRDWVWADGYLPTRSMFQVYTDVLVSTIWHVFPRRILELCSIWPKLRGLLAVSIFVPGEELEAFLQAPHWQCRGTTSRRYKQSCSNTRLY
jgi:hypothetical protein